MTNPKTYPLSLDDLRKERDRLDEFVSDTENLVCALQLVLYDLAGTVIEDPQLKRLRAALIGIGDALEGVVEAAG